MSSHPTGGWTQWDSCNEPPSMCPCRCDHSLHCWRHTFLTRGGRVVSFLKECADTDITVWHPGKHWGVLTVTPQASATCRCNGERVATASPAPPRRAAPKTGDQRDKDTSPPGERFSIYYRFLVTHRQQPAKCDHYTWQARLSAEQGKRGCLSHSRGFSFICVMVGYPRSQPFPCYTLMALSLQMPAYPKSLW